VQDNVLKVKRHFLNDLKPGQLVLVNAAKNSERPFPLQLTIVENDPFHCSLKCENTSKEHEIYGYEQIVEILSVKKRGIVICFSMLKSYEKKFNYL
jgi:D-mannonate dehydratase